MGFKKKIMLELLKKLLYGLMNHRDLRAHMKKVVLVAAVGGILFLAGSILLIGLVINQLRNITAAPSYAEIAALEQLVSNKTIVLNEAQRDQITPLLRNLVNEKVSPEEAQMIKDQIVSVLDSRQYKALANEVVNLQADTHGLIDASRSAFLEWLSKNTGLSAQHVDALIKKFRNWWQTQGAGNEGPENLLKQIEASP